MLLGSQGQLGLEIFYELKNKYDLYAFSRNELDITDNANLKNVILSIKPDFVINCAAYTGVDKAENEKEVCLDINSNSVEELAKLSASEDFVLIHFSTDYIFNAKSSQPIKEEHSPDPINFYGYTKLLGENHIKSLSKCFFIFRISWVFGKHGENFPKKIISLLNERDSIEVVRDQIGSPTSTSLVAEYILRILELNREELLQTFGIYNLCPDGSCSWYEIAKHIEKRLFNKKKIIPVSSSNFKTKARRPNYSLLCNTKSKKTFKIRTYDWKYYLDNFLEAI